MLHTQDAPTEAPDAEAVSIIEAARRLGVSRTHVYRLLAEGELDSFHIGRRHLVTAESVRALIDRGTGRPRAGAVDPVAELLHRTRTERGMALVIDDPAIIAKVAAIVAAGGGEAA